MALSMTNSIIGTREDFYPQNNGEISDSLTQNWTEQAIECYNIKCDCSKCSLSAGNYSFVCQMPKVIKLLVKFVGQPEESKS